MMLLSDVCCIEGNVGEMDKNMEKIEVNKKLCSFLYTSFNSSNLSCNKTYRVS